LKDNIELADLLPMPFWLGPPLPMFLGIYWPWVVPRSTQLMSYVSNARKQIVKKPVSYSTVEEWEISRGPNGRISKITIHRRVIENGRDYDL